MNRCFGESPSRLAYYVANSAEKRSWPRPYLLMQIHSPLLRPEIDQRVVVRGGNNEIEWDGPSKKQQSRKEVAELRDAIGLFSHISLPLRSPAAWVGIRLLSTFDGRK